MPQVRVGISGWNYPLWRGVFYPKGLAHRRELEYASRQFTSIELNGSFYSLQRPESYQLWRDQTPEGTRAVIEREAPGLAEAMRLVNPLGRLSRGIVGIRGQAVICNTPGSPKGCVEQLAAVLDVLPHALRLLADSPTAH